MTKNIIVISFLVLLSVFVSAQDNIGTSSENSDLDHVTIANNGSEHKSQGDNIDHNKSKHDSHEETDPRPRSGENVRDYKDNRHPNFFTQPAIIALGVSFIIAMLMLIILPMKIHFVDENLGYFFLFIGGTILWIAMKMEAVLYGQGVFVQTWMLEKHFTQLSHLLMEAKFLLIFYFSLSFVALIFNKQIKAFVLYLSDLLRPEVLCALFVLTVGSLGSLSVVVVAAIGGIFFMALTEATNRIYTACVIVFSANIGISALLTTVGEPLSLFIAQNQGWENGTTILMNHFLILCVLNSLLLSVVSYFLAKRAPEKDEFRPEEIERELIEVGYFLASEPTVEDIEEDIVEDDQKPHMTKHAKKDVLDAIEHTMKDIEKEQSFSYKMDQLLHSTSKLYFFVIGLLLFGEGIKSFAFAVVSRISDDTMYFINVISAVADNALLGLLEVTPGKDVMTLGISLALWGVALVPGNVCNVVLKEYMGISFKNWAKVGIPVSIGLAVFNFILVKIFASTLMISL